MARTGKIAQAATGSPLKSCHSPLWIEIPQPIRWSVAFGRKPPKSRVPRGLPGTEAADSVALPLFFFFYVDKPGLDHKMP